MFQVEKHILLVGEGNFSFSASLIGHSKHSVIATCLRNDREFSDIHHTNIKHIEDHGGKVYTDVDATCISSHPVIGSHVFDEIIFNFPHRPGKMKIGENRQLLRRFFSSAEEVLSEHGKIRVSLCRGQSGTPVDSVKRKWENSWQVVELAASAGLFLKAVRPFKAEEYPGYSCSGFRGSRKSFSVEGAFVFTFSKAKPCAGFSPQLVAKKENWSDHLQHMKNQWLERHTVDEASPVMKCGLELSLELCQIYPNIVTLPHKDIFFCDTHRQHVAKCNTDVLNLSASVWHAVSMSLLQVECKHYPCLTLPCVFLPSLNSNNAQQFHPHLLFLSDDGTHFHMELQQVVISAFSDCAHAPTIKFDVSNIGNISYKGDILKNSLPLCENLQLVLADETFLSDLKSKGFLIVATFHESSVSGYRIYDEVVIRIFENHNLSQASQPNSCVIGSIYCFGESRCIAFDLISLTMLKYHVFDEKVLFSHRSYFTSVNRNEQEIKIYRPMCLYAPSFNHDVSFWVKENFSEQVLLMFVECYLNKVVTSVNLIDEYLDENYTRSLCYRFVYGGLDYPLSKEKARDIHVNFTRPSLELFLDVSLR